ncbi:mitogen-activated protein kinase kinase kinase 4 isoform X1 [Neodiprion virginianus]|uniref:mitogen-activated protein kinase kinase kinase 4 isoform X1 n=2 Tax=Neodiprion virginianus TaxID=2961670 RepID=UPI001EE6EF93|nr:mitogen-activated protein kinase kinase kinase 4 isoform X1 [Neodiprion virginianus]XP_046611192.1 mitogen-activated protein kinase kinase kinase 4 isoform X1 [Neodiprion virginianus]XP_046611193.1 mitogen-activated protein kinase kinase kinase 4 isoform X1 [Neodiprion virginianus]
MSFEEGLMMCFDGTTGAESLDGDDSDDSKKKDISPDAAFEDSLNDMTDLYGQTPPRTRFNRRQKEKKQKDIQSELKSTSKSVHSKPQISRRNTFDTMLFNEMCDKADKDRDRETEGEVLKEGSRRNKKNWKLSRGSERDLKLDVSTAVSYGKKAEKPLVKTPVIRVETRNRFRSLHSKPVDVEGIKSETDTLETTLKERDALSAKTPKSLSLKEREIFHDTFSFLIKLGSNDKERNCRRQMSHEETLWQNELKDLIWLELQAHHADRSPTAQDEYLCRQREAVGSLLTEIMEFRFDPTSLSDTGSLSTISGDSGIEDAVNPVLTANSDMSLCPGCLSMYCRACTRAQAEALKQVENLLGRLEAAEALYPSSHALAVQYPMYKSQEFMGRVKALCLWYNMTKHQKLKLLILGKLLTLLNTKKRQEESADSGTSSRSSDTIDSVDARQTLVRFNLSQTEENTSPSDSNTSTSSIETSSLHRFWPSTPESGILTPTDDDKNHLDSYLMELDRHAYRKYIEDVLKIRGLRKSLQFLERLHTSVLRKVRLTLEKYDASDMDSSATEEYEGDTELKRYGAWSPESKELNLPSYRAAFVFLSRVPLDVVHEFLRMRLEQKPEQPSALSVRQLMRELREGLKIACVHRQRFEEHSLAAVAADKNTSEILFYEEIQEFDKSLKAVFELYLNYLQQWVDMVQHESFQKNFIEEEWSFIISIAGNISDGFDIASVKFCEMACTMIEQAKEFLTSRPTEIWEEATAEEDEVKLLKNQIMTAAREVQGMFVIAKDKVIRNITFIKCLRRDIQKFSNSPETAESINKLKTAVMDLRHQITSTIENVQMGVNEAEEPKLESDRLALRSRVREVLHQAYKMGFEYHKELCKLFLPEERSVLVRGLVSFALLWMDFVRSCCDRGRGLRPRWANQGLDFLMTVCEPLNTKHLTDQEFEELKTSMDRCISHVIGTATPTSPADVENLRKLPRSRTASPARPKSRTPNSSSVQKYRENLEFPDPATVSQKNNSSSLTDGVSAVTLIVPEHKLLARHQRVSLAVKKLEQKLDEDLINRQVIGHVTERRPADRVHIKSRCVTFTWQRGIKIGQGRFGKVYTVVNNITGELLAMKEVQLQPGDHRAIRRVAEELQIFEGIQHKHLVRYHGIEIHREEMLIFMEFCAEGTLESLVAGSGNGLPEPLVRKYTHQLLLAVSVLHSHGVVHRDIKTANIFLTDEENCLKLGDFGSAVKIKAHTTMPGELQGFVGTQAYMAPEVFMKTESEGHGRAADIWSVGCCVVEMSSGKRPWAEYDSNYQIMFKVGMGESPTPPRHLSVEGHEFIAKCLQHDSKLRPTAAVLLTDTFARLSDDDR